MKKFIIILLVSAIAILTLNSCATTGCKGGNCPIWSDLDHSNFDIQNFKFLEPIIVQGNIEFDQVPGESIL